VPPARSQFEGGEYRLDNGIPVFWIAGEFDRFSCSKVVHRLRELARTESALAIDLRRCTFLDSTAIAVIVRLYRTMRQGSDPRLALVTAEGDAQRLLKVAGIDQVVPIVDDPDLVADELSSGPVAPA
jgi:anti-anti-sigma factor